MKTKKFVISIGLLALVLLGYWYSSRVQHRVRKMPQPTNSFVIDQPEVGPAKDTQCVTDFSMKFGDTSLEDGEFTFRIGDVVPLQATYTVDLTKMPQGSRGYHQLHAAFRPVNSSDDTWAKRNRMEWHFGGNGKKVNDQIWTYTRSRDAKLDPKLVTPGEYEVRVYISVRDPEGENDMIEYLGRMKMQVLPQGGSENS